MSMLKLRLRELKLVVLLFVSWLINLPLKTKDFWLISERGKEARDNGYALYKWLKIYHPEQKVKYILSKDSADYHKIDTNDIIRYNSFGHYLSIWRARCLISTHIMGYTPDHVFFSNFDRKFNIFRKKKKVFLQHGIIKDRLEGLFYRNINVDLFVSGSRLEYDYLQKEFGFPSGIIRYTGLCRFDDLLEFKSQKQILIMPTFRIYVDRNKFEESEYFRAYEELLCSEAFHKIIKEHDYNVIFYPHFEFQSKISSFKVLNVPDKITIADMSYDVQTLLKESQILITDFSSVFFDMMYMNKQVLFYQFDEKKYRSCHYKEGYLNYRDVGPVSMDLNGLLKAIENALTNDIASTYQKYYEQTFPHRDTNNCLRVFNAIQSMLK